MFFFFRKTVCMLKRAVVVIIIKINKKKTGPFHDRLQAVILIGPYIGWDFELS